MNIFTQIVLGVIAVIHLYIFIFEAFLWETRGSKVFSSFPKELFSQTTALAFNQGIYNLFLAAGLAWSLFISDILWQKNIALFFLGCVAVAGVAGAFTAEKKILFVQTVPALAAMGCVLFL